MRAYNGWTAEEKSVAVSMAQKGYSPPDIAEKLPDRSVKSVAEKLRSLGYDMRSVKVVLTDQQREDLRRDWINYGLRELVRRIGVSERVLVREALEMGLGDRRAYYEGGGGRARGTARAMSRVQCETPARPKGWSPETKQWAWENEENDPQAWFICRHIDPVTADGVAFDAPNRIRRAA